MVEYIREKYDDFRIIVPRLALSGGTLLCCAADEVILGHHSSLGPTDPQMTIPGPNRPKRTPAQALVDFMEKIERREKDGEPIGHYQPVLDKITPGLIIQAEQAIDLSESLAREWAEQYMFSGDKNAEEKAEELATFLKDRGNFKSHNRRIGRGRICDETDMKVTKLESDQDLQEYVLSVFHAAQATHSDRSMVKIIENHIGNRYMQQVE